MDFPTLLSDGFFHSEERSSEVSGQFSTTCLQREEKP
jgi:hypothetical protein